MKSILFCCHRISVFTIQKLAADRDLVGIVVPARCVEFVRDVTVTCHLMKLDMLVVGEEDMSEKLRDWVGAKDPDVIITNTFSYKIPDEVLNQAKYGGWNFHCGPLPQYRGPIPLFWQIINGDTQGVMCLHQMTTEFDSGGVYSQRTTTIEPCDTHDVVMNRVGQLAPGMLDELFEALESENVKLVKQDESLAKYYKKPRPDDLTINWESMDAESIVRLLRACNLVANGAMSYFDGGVVRFFEAEAMALSNLPDEKPGTIATVPNDPNLYILCKHSSILRVNVIGLPEAICSGMNFKKMLGVTSGQKFTTRAEDNGF